MPLVFEVVPGQTAVERFDPPGAGATVELSIGVQVRNPNAFGVTLKRVAYETVLAGKAVGTGELEPDVFIASGGQAPLDIRVVASLEDSDLIRAVAKAFSTTPLTFRLDGVAVFDSRSHEFSTARRTLLSGATMARELVTPPDLRLIDAQSRVFLLRPDAPVIRVVVDADNSGAIGYFLSGQDMRVSLGGQEVSVQDVVPVPIPAAQASRFELLFYPQLSHLNASAREALDAALSGIPTLLELRGDLLLDILGVDTYRVEDGLDLSGFVYDAAP